MRTTLKKRAKLKERSFDLLRRMFNRSEIEQVSASTPDFEVKSVVKKSKKRVTTENESLKVELNSMRKVLSYFVDYDGHSNKF